MKKLMPEIDKKISWMNLTTIGVIVVGGVGSWYTTSAQVKENSKTMTETLKKLETETAARVGDAKALDVRLRVVELSSARTDERFNAVLQGIGRIEARLDRMERDK